MDSLTTAILKGLNLSPEENEGKKVKSKVRQLISEHVERCIVAMEDFAGTSICMQ